MITKVVNALNSDVTGGLSMKVGPLWAGRFRANPLRSGQSLSSMSVGVAFTREHHCTVLNCNTFKSSCRWKSCSILVCDAVAAHKVSCDGAPGYINMLLRV